MTEIMIIKTIGIISGVVMTLMTGGSISTEKTHIPHYTEKVITHAGTGLRKPVPTSENNTTPEASTSYRISQDIKTNLKENEVTTASEVRDVNVKIALGSIVIDSKVRLNIGN